MPLIDALRKGVDLSRASSQSVYDATKARLAPRSIRAEAASKEAYARLLGPQFVAKMLNNDAILANIPDPQKREAIRRILMQGAQISNYNPTPAQGSRGGIAAPMAAAAPEAPDMPAPAQAASAGQMPQDSGGYEMPGAGPMAQGAPQMPPQGAQTGGLSAPVAQPSQMPQGQIPSQPPGAATYPAPQGAPPSFAENVANYKGVVKEGEELGTIRAKDIQALNDSYESGLGQQETLNAVSSILASPAFEQIRQTPLLGHHELAYYAKEGTKEQQQMVGKYYTLIGNIVKSSVRDFPGQFRRGEQQLLMGMKPNDSDTVDTARGKVEALSYLQSMMMQRSQIASKLMNQYHINKGQALEIADKQINGEAIRQAIHDKLNPTITIRNKKTGEVVTIPVKQARSMGIQVNG